jgi:hypothetical protein
VIGRRTNLVLVAVHTSEGNKDVWQGVSELENIEVGEAKLDQQYKLGKPQGFHKAFPNRA